MLEYLIDEVRTGVWLVQFANGRGSYELTGPWPVQAVGAIDGVAFYFRGAHDEWEFETENEVGHPFSETDPRAFRRQAKFKNASTMGFRDAAKIISKCANELADERRK